MLWLAKCGCGGTLVYFTTCKCLCTDCKLYDGILERVTIGWAANDARYP